VDNLGQIFLSETLGTALLVLLGCGVVANVLLTKSKGFAGGTLMINIGWGLAVFAGVTVSYSSGAHLNPAVTLGLLISGTELSFIQVVVYIASQLLGGVIGAIVVWLAYKKHFDEPADDGIKLAVFSTGPAIRSYGWNLVTEIVGTFVLVIVIIGFSRGPRRTRGAARRPARHRYRRLARWTHRLRHQPRPRPRSAHRARHPADPEQGLRRLVVRVGPGRRSAHRWSPRRCLVPGTAPHPHLAPADPAEPVSPTTRK
jgi:glycerol uptake facilitator-like aquaporin